jgi:hypothetical protein
MRRECKENAKRMRSYKGIKSSERLAKSVFSANEPEVMSPKQPHRVISDRREPNPGQVGRPDRRPDGPDSSQVRSSRARPRRVSSSAAPPRTRRACTCRCAWPRPRPSGSSGSRRRPPGCGWTSPRASPPWPTWQTRTQVGGGRLPRAAPPSSPLAAGTWSRRCRRRRPASPPG